MRRLARGACERGGQVPDDLHRPYIDEVTVRCEKCGGMRRVAETIDAWFDSGSMPFAQFHHPFENSHEFEARFPADYICEGIDQTRGWFYSLLAVATQVFGRGSYEHCVCLGLIADPEGQKMSTSRGNVADPWEVIDTHGADAFRWYYLSSQQPWTAIASTPIQSASRCASSSSPSGTRTRSGSSTRTRRGWGRRTWWTFGPAPGPCWIGGR